MVAERRRKRRGKSKRRGRKRNWGRSNRRRREGRWRGTEAYIYCSVGTYLEGHP